MGDYRKQVCETIADACINNFVEQLPIGFRTSKVSNDNDRQGRMELSNIRYSISYGPHPYVQNQKREEVKKKTSERVADSRLLTKQVDSVQPGCVLPVVMMKRKTRVIDWAKKWLMSLRRK